ASQRLKLSYSEFADTTPVEFEALLQEWKAELDHTHMLFGSVCAAVIEPHRNEEKRSEPYTWRDFFNPLTDPQTSEPVNNDAAVGVVLDDFWVMTKSRKRRMEAQAGRKGHE